MRATQDDDAAGANAADDGEAMAMGNASVMPRCAKNDAAAARRLPQR